MSRETRSTWLRCLARLSAGLTVGASAGLGAPAAFGQTTRQPLRIATANITDDFTPTLYATKAGLFSAAGLDVSVTVMSNGSAIAAAVAGGALDIGKGSLISLMGAHVHDVPMVLVAAGSLYNAKAPYAGLIISLDSTLIGARDLSGKTVAVPAIGDLNTLATSRWVDEGGGDAKSLKFVEMSQSAQAVAVSEHRVDAAVLTQPYLELALETGKVRVLGSPYTAISPTFMFAGWFAMRDWALKHPDLVRSFARVLATAARYTNTHHAETAPLLADASKMPLATIERISRIETATTLDASIVQPMIDAAAKYQLIPRGFPAKEILFDAGQK